MSSAERIGTAVVAVAMATTLVLPGRQTPAILANFFAGASKLMATVTGQ